VIEADEESPPYAHVGRLAGSFLTTRAGPSTMDPRDAAVPGELRPGLPGLARPTHARVFGSSRPRGICSDGSRNGEIPGKTVPGAGGRAESNSAKPALEQLLATAADESAGQYAGVRDAPPHPVRPQVRHRLVPARERG